LTMTVPGDSEPLFCHWLVLASKAMQDARQIEDPEMAARVCGLIAVLALPPTRRPDGSWAKRAIEILDEREWHRVERVLIVDHWIIFGAGAHVHRREWRFHRTEVPPWREVREQLPTVYQ
jgi:hypothetical protein